MNLHDIIEVKHEILLWVSAHYLHLNCTSLDPTRPRSHHVCADVIARTRSGTQTRGTIYCECHICARDYPYDAHYIFVTNNRLFNCDACDAGQHPVPPR